MPPNSGACPVGVDLNDPAQVHVIYSRFLTEYSQTYRDSQEATNEALMNQHLQSDYGTTDKFIVIAMWLANPTDPLLVNGDWGYGHAALSMAELNTMQSGGSTDAQITQRAQELYEHYFVREAIARCQGLGGSTPQAEWLNPANWYEDSRLDYYTPLLFIKWFLTGL